MPARSRLGRLSGLLALTVFALFTCAASAIGATWTANVPLSNQLGGDAETPAVSVAPTGAALVVWRNLEDNSVRYQERAAGAAFTANSSATLEAPGSSSAEGRPAVALNSAGAAVVAWAAGSFGDEIVKASYRPAGGSFSAAATISAAGEDANAPDVAIDATGKAVVVWSVGEGPFEPRFAEASVHGPSGGFSAGEVVNRDEDDGYSLPLEPRVAMDGAGDAIVVYPSERPGGPGTLTPLQWAYMGAGADVFGAPTDLPSGHTPDVAFGGNERATVTWQRDGVVYAAEQGAAGGAFGAENQASAPANGSASKPTVGIDGAGNATVAYQAGSGDTSVFVSTRPSGGGFGEPKQLSSVGDSGDATMAVAPGGAAVAAWTRFDGSKETVEGSYRPGGGAFGTTELLSKNGGGTPIAGALTAVGVDTAGNATVAWQRMEFFGVVFATSYAGGGSEPPPSGGGGIQTPVTTAAVTPPAATPKPPTKRPLKCRKGFKKKKVAGKRKCVKVRKATHAR